MTASVIDRPKTAITPDLVDAVRHEAMRELCRRARVCAEREDWLGWGQIIFVDKFTLPFCLPLHGYLVQIAEWMLTATEAPRNHAKTLIECFLVPVALAIHKPKAYRHYLNVQATEDKALGINRTIKVEFEENALLRMYLWLYYGRADYSGERWTDKQFALYTGVVFTSVGAGQSIRGLNYRSRRPDFIVVDDLYDEEDITNIESTAKKNTWFWSSLYPARAKGRACCIHVQGTAINHEDLLAKLEKKERWHHRVFRALLEDGKTVLWPELNSYDDLMADRADMGSLIWSREMQNERMDEATAIVKLSWLKDWEYDPAELKFDHRLRLSDVILACDPSIGEGLENDYTGTVVILKATSADGGGHSFYIDQLDERHLTMDERIANLVRMAADARLRGYPVTVCRLEGVAGFKDFVAQARARTNLPIRDIGRDGKPLQIRDKIATLMHRQRFFENKKVKISKAIPETLRDRLRHQLATNYPKNDDIRDAVMLALDPQLAAPASAMASGMSPGRGAASGKADWM